MNECIDSLVEGQTFSIFDENLEYWQTEMDDEDVKKTAIDFRNRLCKYSRIPFGLKNAPRTFQRAMDVILALIKGKYAMIYIDDSIMFLKT